MTIQVTSENRIAGLAVISAIAAQLRAKGCTICVTAEPRPDLLLAEARANEIIKMMVFVVKLELVAPPR